MMRTESSYSRSGPDVCQIVRLVYAVTNTAIQVVAYLLHWGLFGALSVQLCALLHSLVMLFLIYSRYYVGHCATAFFGIFSE